MHLINHISFKINFKHDGKILILQFHKLKRKSNENQQFNHISF